MESWKGGWYCEKCNMHMNFYSRERHLESKTHKGERKPKLSEEERLEARKETQAKYLSKQYYCEPCNLFMLYKCRNHHMQSKAHNRLVQQVASS